MLCIWSSWCHCQPSCSSKIQNGLPFWCRLSQMVLEKRLLNGCSSSSSSKAVICCMVFVGPCFDQSLEHAVGGSYNSNAYSASIVAGISVLCVIVSLFAGFLLGVCVSRITFRFTHPLPAFSSSQVDARSWRSMSTKDILLEPERVVRQNPYDVEPVKTFHTFHPYSVSDVPSNLAKHHSAPRQHNIFVNDLKPNNSKLANGPVASTSVYPRRGVYL